MQMGGRAGPSLARWGRCNGQRQPRDLCKYRNDQLPKGSRIALHKDFWTRYSKPNAGKAIEAYYEVAKKYKLDLAQMSLKFLEIQPFVTSVIIGATTMEQLKTDIESVNINLTEEIINEINEVQKIYPNPCP